METRIMKKIYLKPAIEVIPLETVNLLVGSGPGAGDQTNPNLGDFQFENVDLEALENFEF